MQLIESVLAGLSFTQSASSSCQSCTVIQGLIFQRGAGTLNLEVSSTELVLSSCSG